MKNRKFYVLLLLLSIFTYFLLDSCGAIDIAHNLINQVECKIEQILDV